MANFKTGRAPIARFPFGPAAAVALAATFALACGTGAVRYGSATASPAASAAVSGSSDGAALALQRDFIRVVRTVSPAVVVIETAQGLGSGIVYDANGDIVTNAHVTDGSRTFSVTLADGRQFRGTLVGSYPSDDLAVVHIDANNLTPATFADSSKLVVGDIVLAVGNPLGLQSSVSEGIVSALGRTASESSNVTLPNLIQTSAAINPGNSGGALVNLSGQVVGIPTLGVSDPQMGGAAVGIGFAIPSNTVTDIAGQLIKYGKVVDSHRAWLGVNVADVLRGTGVLVHSETADGPAAKAGIKPGELITSVAGQPTPSGTALADILANLSPGQTVPVTVVQPDGPEGTVHVTLGELPG